MSVAPIRPADIGALPEIAPVDSAREANAANGGKPVAEAFLSALDNARRAEVDASQASEKFAKGDTSIGIHEVVITAEKANIAVRYATTLKNKALEAYRELMNTQV